MTMDDCHFLTYTQHITNIICITQLIEAWVAAEAAGGENNTGRRLHLSLSLSLPPFPNVQ